MQTIPVDVARRLLPEALAFYSGERPYLTDDSELRAFTSERYRGECLVSHILQTCSDIFFTICLVDVKKMVW